MKTRVVAATEFKAKCLAFLDEVEGRGGPITITRRGLPVAVLQRAPKRALKSPRNSWSGRMKVVGDIVHGDPELWDVTRPD